MNDDDPLLGAPWSQLDERRREIEWQFAHRILWCVIAIIVLLWITGAFA